MLEREFDYFVKNQDELVAKYNGRVLVIKGQEVVGVYNSEIEAYIDAQKKYELGTFLIQVCKPGEDAYTQVFHSRVSFN